MSIKLLTGILTDPTHRRRRREPLSPDVLARIQSLRLPSGMKVVLATMAWRADDDGRKCYPSIAWLVAQTGFSERWVQLCIARLVKQGLVERERLGGGRGRLTVYRIKVADAVTPQLPLESAEAEAKAKRKNSDRPFTVSAEGEEKERVISRSGKGDLPITLGVDFSAASHTLTESYGAAPSAIRTDPSSTTRKNTGPAGPAPIHPEILHATTTGARIVQTAVPDSQRRVGTSLAADSGSGVDGAGEGSDLRPGVPDADHRGAGAGLERRPHESAPDGPPADWRERLAALKATLNGPLPTARRRRAPVPLFDHGDTHDDRQDHDRAADAREPPAGSDRVDR